MAGSVLTPAVIESLFERGAPLYPSTDSELAAIARGDKGNCELHFRREHETEMARFTADAKRLGLSVTRREIPMPGEVVVELCATRPGEEWRAEVVSWVLNPEARHFAISERSTYLRSRAFGYSHAQAAAWTENCRHQTPVHGRDAVYLFPPLAAAERVSAAKGDLTLREPLAITLPQLYYGGLRRNALDLLPKGFAIGRAAVARGALVHFFNYQPHRVLITECSAKDCAQLASSLLSPIDFWDGEQWSPKPRSSR